VVPHAWLGGLWLANVTEDGHWLACTPGKSEYRHFPPVRLGSGQHFPMGGNRDTSLDSRAFGPVSGREIPGKVIAVFPAGQRVARGDEANHSHLTWLVRIRTGAVGTFEPAG
jgi:hypothetical protein